MNRAYVDVQVLLDGLLDLLRAAHHARRRAAQLQHRKGDERRKEGQGSYTGLHRRDQCAASCLDEVFAHFRAVEHRVERRNLVHLHRRHIQHRRHLIPHKNDQ